MAVAETGVRKEEGPVLETGGTANLTTQNCTRLHGDPRVLR
jgi:hypothetical protein